MADKQPSSTPTAPSGKRRVSHDYQRPEYIEVSVSDPVTHMDDAGKPQYTDYLITVETTLPEYAKQNFTVRRRYKEFAWLKEHLREKMEEKGKRLSIADLPGNSFSSWLGFGGARYDKEFVEERRRGLEAFMVSCVNHPWARFEEGLHKFLEDQTFKCED